MGNVSLLHALPQDNIDSIDFLLFSTKYKYEYK